MRELRGKSHREPASVTVQRDALRELEHALAVAEVLDAMVNSSLNSVAGLSFEDDDPMARAGECVFFARGQLEDVLGGLRRASDRIRDDMGVPRRGADLRKPVG